MKNLVDMCPNIEFLRLDQLQPPSLYADNDDPVVCRADAFAAMRFPRLKSFHAYGSHLLDGFPDEQYSLASIPLDDGAFLLPVSNPLYFLIFKIYNRLYDFFFQMIKQCPNLKSLHFDGSKMNRECFFPNFELFLQSAINLR